MRTIRLGTRGSRLALIQAHWVKDRLERAQSVQVEIVKIKTQGDRLQSSSLALGDDTGLFTKGIEEALLRGDVDLAVHSLKDLPTVQPSGLTVAAVPQRLDAHDALVSRDRLTLESLGAGIRVGTSSVRRRAQLLAMNRDIEVVDLRGNLDTRLKRLFDGDFDAIVVAMAGLIRMQRGDFAAAPIPFDDMLPAAGQGALAIETRQADEELMKVVAELNHAASAATTAAERMVLHRLGAGCQVPIGVLGEVLNDGGLRLRCAVYSKDGHDVAQAGSIGGDPADVVDELVKKLWDQGAADLVAAAREG
jgi:hydroxymethylbilane synthase